MGGIFLRRSTKPKVEVINDISGDVATFFRVLQEHYPYFIDMLRFRVASRGEFDRLCGMDPARLTDLQRAARGQFLLSINDHPVVRECFAAFHLHEVETTWSISTAHGGAKVAQELIISNFQP